MSSAAQPSGFELAVAEGLLSALPQSPLALETARKFLKDDGLSLEEVEAQLRALIDAPKPCEACGAALEESAGACPNCGHVVEADTVADYPQQQQPRPRPKRRRKRKAEPDDLAEATVTLNAIDAGGHVTGVPTAWGGVNPAVATAPLPLEAYPGVSTPPNLREADGWERCGNCVFFFKGCNLYGVDRPAANVVHGFQYPVHYSDICDSHASLTPLEDRVTEARAQLAEAVAAGDTERVVRLRARVKVLDEGIFSELLHPRSPKGRVGGGQFAAKIGALKPGESLKVGKVTVKHKAGKPAGASLTGHETKPHYRVEGPGIEGFSHHIAHTPEEAARLATVAAQPRKKSKRATGRAQAARPRVALQEVSSRVYPGLDRSPKENWVDKAGGLPSYIERIAKHLHYEKGMTISHAIAVGVNTVKKWCAGGKGNTSAATKAKACAAVAEWEAKKAKSKAKTATKSIAETVEAEARRDGVWRYPSVEEAERIVEGAEQMDDVYPALGSELELPRYVNRVAGHLHSRGKSPGEAVAIALSTARAVAEGDAGAKTLREEARAAADEYEARAVGWAAELVEAVEWTTREGERLGGPTPPSEGFIRKLHTEIAQADGPRWWEGMAEADARELEEAGGLHVLKRAGEGLIDFDPKKHPRAAKGRKGGGRFVDVLGKLDTAAKAGRANPPTAGTGMPSASRAVKKEAYKGYTLEQEPEGHWTLAEDRSRTFKNLESVKRYIDGPGRATPPVPESARGIPVTGGLRISPAALEGIIGDALKVGNEKAVDNYISKVNEKWGAPWETIRPALLKVVEDTRALRAGAAASHGEDRGRANQPIDDGWKGFVAQMNGERTKVGRETQSIGDPSSPGRGPSGKLRNFKAMNEGKLSGVISDLANYGPGDQEALNAAVAAAHEKGMSVPSVETPAAAPAPAAAAPGGELSIDHAIGSVLQSHGDDLKDWHLSGPAPVNGQKRWTLDVELKTGQKHSILIGEDGTVELAGQVQPFTEAEKDKAKKAVVDIMDAQPEPLKSATDHLKPHAQHSAAAQHVQAIGTEDLQPTGEEESPYHMTDGTYYKGKDGKTYQKLESGPKLMMSKKGPIPGIRVKNVDLGTEKKIPSFTVSGHYYAILAPGGGGYQGDIADTPTPDEPTGDVYELLKKSIAGESGTVFGAGAGTGSVGELEASDFAGKKIVITGAIPGMTRKEAGEALAAHGATLQSSVTKATDYLITGENVGQTKTQAAEKKGVTVIHYVDIEHLLESAVVDDAARLAWVELELSEAGSNEELVRLRARRDALRRRLDEGIFNRLLHPRSPKGRKGGGEFSKKAARAEDALKFSKRDAKVADRMVKRGRFSKRDVKAKIQARKGRLERPEFTNADLKRLAGTPEGDALAGASRHYLDALAAKRSREYDAHAREAGDMTNSKLLDEFDKARNFGLDTPRLQAITAEMKKRGSLLRGGDYLGPKTGRETTETDEQLLKRRVDRERQPPTAADVAWMNRRMGDDAVAGGWTRAALRPEDPGYDADYVRRLTSRALPPRKLGRDVKRRLNEVLDELDEEARNG